MREPAGGRLTEIKGGPPADAGSSYRLLVVVFFPIIAIGAFTAVLAVIAALIGWHREEMLLTAAGIGCLLAIPTVVLIHRERADREQARRALENVQARVGGIVESAMDAIITIDEAQRVVQFNAAAERAFRWPRGAVIGQRLDMLIPERFRGAHAAHIERFGQTQVTSRGMGAQTVLYGLRADGQEFPIEASISQHSEDGGKLSTVILRDVTQRVSAEAMLARSEARLRGILDSAMDAIITIDGRQHIVLFNAAAEEVFNCSREEAIGAPLAWFIPERFRGPHADHVREFGEGVGVSRRMGHARVVVGLRRDGEEFPIEASISKATEGGQPFYTVILRDVTQRVRAEKALRESRDEIQALALEASGAREDEKRRIARELHDELGQALTSLKIDVSWLRDNLAAAPPEVQRKLAAMQLLLDGTVAAARRISADLRPLMLDDLGLTAAADWLAQNFANRTGIPCELVIGAGEMDLPDPYATAVFRVLQESLTNIAKHAQATQVEATLEREGEEVVLTVRDNGSGFDMGEVRKPGSFGLVGLRERAYLVGGDISVRSTPGHGTTVELRIPTKGPEAPA